MTEKKKNERKKEKLENFAANLHGKTEYVMHIRNLKQALKHGSVLKKVHRIMKSNQKVWLNSYIDMNTDLSRKPKADFEKDFF